MQDFLSSVTDWSFMNEPLWRWFMFFGAMLAITYSWHGLVDLMK